MIFWLFWRKKEIHFYRVKSKKIGYSLSTVNRVMKEFTELKYINEDEITNESLVALKPYWARRAMIVAILFGCFVYTANNTIAAAALEN